MDFSPSQATVLDGGEGHHEVVANSGKVLRCHPFRGHRLHLRVVASDLDVVEGRHLEAKARLHFVGSYRFILYSSSIRGAQ